MEQVTHLSSGIPGVRLIDAEHNRFSFPRHFHLEYHIGLLLQGRHRYAAGGERRLAGAGDALLMAPESIHDGSSAGEEGYRIRVLALDADWLERASRDFSDGRRGAPRLTSSLVRDERLQQRLRQLHLGMLGGAAALENRLALEEHLWQALACLLSLGQQPAPGGGRPGRLRPARLDAAARLAGVAPGVPAEPGGTGRLLRPEPLAGAAALPPSLRPAAPPVADPTAPGARLAAGSARRAAIEPGGPAVRFLRPGALQPSVPAHLWVTAGAPAPALIRVFLSDPFFVE